MAAKRHIEEVIEDVVPTALVIGNNKATVALTYKLESQGCAVTSVTYFPTSLLRFDYIFQFGHIDWIQKVRFDYLQKHGKYVFIATDEQLEDMPVGIRIVKIGDIDLWKMDELIDALLRILYSKGGPHVVDIEKKSVKPSVARSVSPPHVKKKTIPILSSYRQIKQPARVHALVEHKFHFFTRTKLAILVIFLFIATAFISGLFFWYTYTVQNTISQFRLHVASSDWEHVQQDLQQAKQEIGIAKKALSTVTAIVFPLANVALVRDISTVITVSEQSIATGEELLALGRNFQNKSFGSITAVNTITSNDIDQLQKNLVRLATNIHSSKQEIEKVKLSFFPKESFIALLNNTETKLKDTYDIAPLLKTIAVTDETKVYLLLLQNNMELRPTGGFIGSYGLLTIQKGKVVDFRIEDVYTADGQLKGHVDPPSPIAKYLNQPHFFLRDSNFDPDFAASSVRAAWFLQKEMGNTVDGVIGVNLFFVQKLLRVFGPLRISEFGNDEITADNFFLKAQYYSQSDFFPGSSQKKDFLTAVTTSLFAKGSFDKNSFWIQLLPVVRQSLDEKNITFFFSDETMQKLIEEKGWGGRIVQVKCVTNQTMAGSIDNSSCYPDYAAVIEANLGVNKANFFVSKSVAVEKNIDTEGKIGTTITLSYENTNTPEIYGAIYYTNYLRVITPLGSSLAQVTLNNIPLSVAEIDTEQYGGDKTSFGFLIKIAPKNKAIVKITYTLARLLTAENGSYQFLYQKQPGDKLAPLVFSLQNNSQFNFKPMNFSSSLESALAYTTDTSVDRIFAFEKLSQ